MADWNLIITICILALIALWVLAKIQGLTIMELITEIKDFFGEKKDAVQESAVEVYE